ncbi:hypothetical protein [Paraburkholderia rhizosphaerae]
MLLLPMSAAVRAQAPQAVPIVAAASTPAAAPASTSAPTRGSHPASTAFVAPVGAVMAVPAPGVRDERSFMHGIGQADGGDGKTWVFFSSSGVPPHGAGRNGSWPHDVYVGQWEPGTAHLSNVRIFIKRPEAQEPASVAQNTKGTIFITFEDGWNAPRNVSQRYGVYRQNLKPIRPYPRDVESGGHSGHVAAVGDQFVVFYSADWVQGGGVDNLGTGGGVYANVYDGNGRFLRHVNVAAHVREWWPVVAGSPTQALFVWQKYIPGSTIASLQYALFDPRTGKLTRTQESVDPYRVQYYVYASAYVPAVDRFVVLATLDTGRAVAFLVDGQGRRTAELDCLPALVRESNIAVEGNAVFVPTQDGRMMTLGLEGDHIVLRGTQRAPFAWGNTGVTGIVSGDMVHFVSLSPDGLREADFSTQKQIAASPGDRCVVRASK